MTDEELIEAAAKAAYEGAFLKHAPEDVDRWEDLVVDNIPAVESWREVARHVLTVLASARQDDWEYRTVGDWMMYASLEELREDFRDPDVEIERRHPATEWEPVPDTEGSKTDE
ncbi:hypothetical protein [Microbacterium terrisoli]|uniref:hypothetical protein n=1 Tax=Microbacterium terrisoli TaxID=3242192 RepID=UPI0028054A38|nr:hypothetical protein [Microbacterium protaetiae]